MSSGLRIAVADDDRDTREYLTELLPRLGHQVVAAAENGRQLAEHCRAAHPDLVITDVRIPDMDGIEAAAAVNQEAQTPVLLVSAHHDQDILSRLAPPHIMGYIVKPITEGDVKAGIALAMLRFRHFQALAKEAGDLRQALDDRKVIERAKGILMRRLHVDEDEGFRRLRRLSNDRNLKLIEVARQVVESEGVFAQLDRN